MVHSELPGCPSQPQFDIFPAPRRLRFVVRIRLLERLLFNELIIVVKPKLAGVFRVIREEFAPDMDLPSLRIQTPDMASFLNA